MTTVNTAARTSKVKVILEPVSTEVIEIFTDHKPLAPFVTVDLTIDPLELRIVLLRGSKHK